MVPCLLSALLLVQATQSSVAGTVRDGESGEPLASAIVALTDIDRSVMSDSAGRYIFRAVPPGPQHITVKQIGYAPRTLHALVPASGELEINIALRPVPIQLPVLVVRSTVILRSLDEGDSSSSSDRGISIAALRNHPLLAEPDGLLGLTGGAIAASPESPSGVHVRGGASDQTAFLLDGVPIFSPYHAAGTFSAWNPDALERLEVFSAARSPAFPDVLSGTIAAVTRAPGSTVRAQGGVSTTQARLAVDGPLGVAGAGYLLSGRGGFPGTWAPDNDPSYLRSKTRDLLAKVETPGLGGRLRFLLYDTGNEIGATASPLNSTHPGPVRNVFHWHSRSLGAQWVGRAGKATLRLQAWSASGDAEAGWIPPSTSPVEMAAEREDGGLQAVMEQSSPQATTVAGARFQWSRTGYRVGSAGDSPFLDLSARTPMGTVFLQHERPLGDRLRAQLAFSSTAFGSGIYLNPRAELRWQLSAPIVLSASYVRSHQFSQSLRNPESVVGNIFPADLYIGAAVPGVPIARSDRGVVAAEYRPLPGMRLAAQVYLTDYAGLLLVAPRGAEPFATTSFATGSGTAPGFAVDAALGGPRYGLLASYGWQRVRLGHADSSYAPVYGNDHLVELGAIVFPSPSFSIRAGATAVLGRRATGVTGAFEWEACNLVDQGCEFSGSPQATGSLGATRLPSYLRLDLSLRKHWHLSIAGKDVTMALFGTITNLLGRTNILTIATDPATGNRSAIEMRPLAPLVAGLDWRF